MFCSRTIPVHVNLVQSYVGAVTESRPYRSTSVSRILLVVIFAGVLLAVGVFLVDTGDAQPEPVDYSETLSFGLPDEDRHSLEERGLSVPRVQIFYSQYTYVVGYEGVERAVETLNQPEHRQQFGDPLTIYVSDYAGTGLDLTENGYLDPQGDPGWVRADEAWFVVDSDAKTPVSETIVPFASENEAHSFADDHGGTVVDWPTAESHETDLDDASAVRETVPELHDHADDRLAAASPLLDREISVVVGTDEPTIQDAIDAAPPESTVLVPPGTYDEEVEIDRPVTLRGEGATVRGNDSQHVIEITHDDAAVSGVSLTGIGEQTRADESEETEDWDAAVERGYGHSDAGIRVTEASGVYVHNVSIETPSSGVLVRDAPETVIQGLTVDGTDVPMDGFMGVLAVRSSVVVDGAVVDGGRDGVYLHRAAGSVVRNSTFSENRFGVHFMYTSDSLIADNVAREQTSAGITIMTSPARNAVVDNDIRYATDGIVPGGSRSYIAGNVLAHNQRGMMTGTSQSVYERNVVYGNDIGVRSGSTLPSNVVRANDFVANEKHAQAGTGPLRVWTDGGEGNYWEGATGSQTGETLDQSYSPTDPVESNYHTTDGAITLAASPAMTALAEIRATSPGLRSGSIVDTNPLADPVSPTVLEALEDENNESTGSGDAYDD